MHKKVCKNNEYCQKALPSKEKPVLKYYQDQKLKIDKIVFGDLC